MTSRRILFYIFISLVFLSGCANKEKNSEYIVLDIPSPNEYTSLSIQPIDGNGGTSEAKQKVITDKKKILGLVHKMNQMKVIQSPSKEFNESIEELNQHQSYAVSLTDTSDKQFDMIFFKDGSIQFFQHTEEEIVPSLSKAKHPKLLQEITNLSELQN
ncbi:hypothetical protein [Peribacillus sp. NPDC097295]|uniref:hypothetical protein n=1 Tax=Peribacillus sp. NPDC097295 TaxID=3364402 RepID=UPI00382785AB